MEKRKNNDSHTKGEKKAKVEEKKLPIIECLVQIEDKTHRIPFDIAQVRLRDVDGGKLVYDIMDSKSSQYVALNIITPTMHSRFGARSYQDSGKSFSYGVSFDMENPEHLSFFNVLEQLRQFTIKKAKENKKEWWPKRDEITDEFIEKIMVKDPIERKTNDKGAAFPPTLYFNIPNNGLECKIFKDDTDKAVGVDDILEYSYLRQACIPSLLVQAAVVKTRFRTSQIVLTKPPKDRYQAPKEISI